MEIKKEKIKDFCVLMIEGRIDTTNFNQFEIEINLLFNSGEKNFVFNCEGLNYISSSGLRVFLIAQKKSISLNGKLHLCNLQPNIKEIFDISGFSSIFKIYETQEQALEA
ncbi:MAG: STAS domain-containing protein [Prolixibacteraceae bacterium]|nr:STAS domain-containing protein [Prolixibacteraceae bacterium]